METDINLYISNDETALKQYDPLISLKNALNDWLYYYTQGPGPAIPP